MSYTETTIRSYLGSSLQGPNFSNQTNTENDKHVAEEEADGILYDFISFLALVSRSTSYTDWTSIGMNLVHISTSNIALAERKRYGSSFSISLVDRNDLSAMLPHDMAHLNLPRLLAVKTPILNSPLGARRNRHIFDSMTREYEILNHKSLKKHENIVRLIGCCWRTVDMESDLTVPNLVLEGADLGDLEDFYQRHGGTITMRKRLGLCIDVATGVEALHLAGILHGDIKPRNILVFKNQDRGFIAKIADFGSSIPLYQSTFPRKACPGTRLFAAPELVNSSGDHSRDELLKAEIYTLGLVFVLLVRGLHTLDKLRSARSEDVASLKEAGELADWILQEDENRLFDPMARPTFGKQASERERQRGIWRWLETQEYNRAHALWARGKVPSFENVFVDKDWITLANARLKSEKSETLFSGLVNRIMSAQPSRRPVDVHHVLQDLRQILTLELRALYDPNHPHQMLYEKQLASSRRRLNPGGLHEGVNISYLNLQEIDSIILNHALSYGRPRFVRDFYFIWRFGGIAKFPKQHRPPTRSRWLGLRHQTQKRAQRYMARQKDEVKGYIKLVVKKWSRNHQKFKEQKWADTGEVFQATLDERYTSLLPESVRNEVIRQLQYIADSPGEIQSRRLLACFEHALMTLCYDDASRTDPELIPTALNYMLHAAASGHQPAQSLVGRLFGVFGHELPIGRDTETKWLFQASLRGSLTAMKRLQMLNPAVHQQADRLIRFKHNGSFVEGEVWKDTEYLLFLISAGLADVPPGFVHNLAAHGQLESLRRLSHLPHQTFNTQNGLGETPLVAACRCGHANIVQLLLTLGADPSIGTFGNVHPLHFLSAFPDEDIPQISDLLLRHGAELEIYSQRGSVYKQGIDGRFGVDEGTPLLWSVITGNVVAIQELLRHGANIFSYIHLHEWEMTSEVVIHCSPLESAIAMYRYNIVNLLLSSCTNREELLRGLNDLRLVGQRVRATPLLMALEKQTVSRLSPMLLHGHLRHHAQLRTVEMLLHYGSDPLRLSQEQSGESIHAIEVVCQDDNLLLLDFLWNYDGARLRPPPRLYFKCVSLAIRRSKRTIFDFLLSHQHDIAQVTETRKLKLELLEKTCSLSTDTHYVSSVVHSIVHGLPLAPSAATIKPDFTQPLLIALMAGNTEASRLLCQYGHCNLTKGPDNLSMLASVIVLDATSPIVKDRVDHLLHLVSSFFPPALKRKLFWKCASYNAHGRRGQLTAFQFVFARREIAHDTTIIPATANSEIWRNLLRAFNEPDFLNAQVDPRSPDFPGDTALHMAARAGCMKEISDMLAGQYGGSFELSLVNRHNETVLDVCIAHHEILVNEVEDRLMHLGTLSTEGALLKKIRDLQAAVGTLIERGCGISTFCLLALKKSEKIFLIVRRPNILMHVPYKPGYTFGKHSLSANVCEDIAQLLRLEVGSLIPFVDVPSDYGKVLSEEMDDFIQKLD